MAVAAGIMVIEKLCKQCGESFIGTREDVSCPECKGEEPTFLVVVRSYYGPDSCDTIEHVVVGHQALESLLVECGEEGSHILNVSQMYLI